MNTSTYMINTEKCGDIAHQLKILWYKYAEWMRMYIISKISESNDINHTLNRLYRTPAEFAALLKKYCKVKTAKAFEELFTYHLLTAVELADDLKSQNIKTADKTRRKWYTNADELACILSDINPGYSKHEWRAMLYDHLFMTEREMILRIACKYEEEILEYENIIFQAGRIADMMSEEIIKYNSYEIIQL